MVRGAYAWWCGGTAAQAASYPISPGLEETMGSIKFPETRGLEASDTPPCFAGAPQRQAGQVKAFESKISFRRKEQSRLRG
jgi:hypothetical protein